MFQSHSKTQRQEGIKENCFIALTLTTPERKKEPRVNNSTSVRHPFVQPVTTL